MRKRLPAPPKGWRVLALEVGVVVLGVLIALGAENWLENRHWQEQARLARQSIGAELAEARIDALERLAVQPCLRGQIAALNDRLSESRGSWTAMPMKLNALAASRGSNPVIPATYRAPLRLWRDDAWQAGLASEALNHLPQPTVASYSQAYNRVGQLLQLQEREASAAARLSALSSSGPLNDVSRIELLAEVAEVDRANAVMEYSSLQLIQVLRPLLKDIPPQDVRREVEARLAIQRELRGDCVRSLSLNL